MCTEIDNDCLSVLLDFSTCDLDVADAVNGNGVSIDMTRDVQLSKKNLIRREKIVD